MFEVSSEINFLITQGRLLQEHKPAQISVQAWLERYLKLETDGDLEGKGQRKGILDGLSTDLYAQQFATELKTANSASV